MKKQILTPKYLKTLKLLKEEDYSLIFLTTEGEIVKILKPNVISIYKIMNIDYEKKLLNEGHYYISNEIAKPNTVLYSQNGVCCGFKAKRAKGIDINTFDLNLNLQEILDLSMFTTIYKNLENIVKKNKDIVFPDLCTCDNIFVNRKNNGIELIDYDGMQVGHHKGLQVSTTLHQEKNNYYIPKYFKNGLFNKNLDKKSLILFYFLFTFHADLNNIGTINPYTRKPITLETVFNIVGLEDYEMYDKVQKIFDDNQDNVYLEDSLDRISKDYKLIISATGVNGTYMKKLVRK